MMHNLFKEKSLFKAGYINLACVDEAGRGALAGPVVAACVNINKQFKIKNKALQAVRDSKKISPKERQFLYDIIIEEFADIGVGIIDRKISDKINILQANFLAMKQAALSLKNQPDFILVDGNQYIPNLTIQQEMIIKGDNKVFLIAAASIVAKVTRDKIMCEYDRDYPQYGFAIHKGYGTKAHLANLIKFGYSPIHRLSFAPVKLTSPLRQK
jgi:ribonuclease HII